MHRYWVSSERTSTDTSQRRRTRERRIVDGLHATARARDRAVGDRVMLLPRHACTTAYLCPSAVVLNTEGSWQVLERLASRL
ncbi:hypothetical protein [Paraburkholderia fungorum]|uniref:hypothetical protein n=1 Tax=Paraburkholderia fungorum TaxID=134537 RepID=UPI0011EA65F0|nr:hypothetical protein [Paraburkholderia fungorum]